MPIDINPDAPRMPTTHHSFYDDDAPYMRGRENGFQRTQDQIIIDRRALSSMMKKGWDEFDMWEEINKNYPTNPLSFETVKADIKFLRKLMIENTTDDLREMKAEMLAMWRNLMKTYWEGYQRSLGNNTDPSKLGYKTVEETNSKFYMAEVERAKLTGKMPRQNQKDIKIKKIEIIGTKQWLDGVRDCLKEIGKLQDLYPKAVVGDVSPDNGSPLSEDEDMQLMGNKIFSLLQLGRAKQNSGHRIEEPKRIKRLLPDGTLVDDDGSDDTEGEVIETQAVNPELNEAVEKFFTLADKEVEKLKTEDDPPF